MLGAMAMAHPTILNRRVGRHPHAQHSFAPRTLLSVRLGGLFLAMGLLLTGCPSRDSVGLRAIGLLGEVVDLELNPACPMLISPAQSGDTLDVCLLNHSFLL